MLFCFLADVAQRPEGTYIVQHSLPRFRQDETLTVLGFRTVSVQARRSDGINLFSFMLYILLIF